MFNFKLKNKMRKILSFSLLAFLLLIGTNAWGAPGDEIKSPTNVVSGKWYYIKGTYNASSTDYDQYYGPTEDDTKGTKVTSAAVTNLADAMPVLFTQVTGGWTLQTPNGNYIRPHSSNGQSYFLEDAYVLTLSAGTTKEGSNKGIRIGKYTASSKDWYLQANQTTAKIGGYKATQWDVTLIEASAITITSAKWASYSCAVPLDFSNSDVTAYIAVENNDASVTLSQIEKVPANTGIIVNANTAETYVIPTFSGDADATTGNLLVKNLTEGPLDAQTDGKYNYTLAVVNNTPVFKRSSGEGNLGANKAYLQTSAEGTSDSGSAPSIIHIVNEENNATNIGAVNATEKAVKFFEDGRLLIRKGDIIYDTLGRIVR